jgi:hypothetical protein
VKKVYLVAKINHKTTYKLTSIPFTAQYNLTRGRGGSGSIPDEFPSGAGGMEV